MEVALWTPKWPKDDNKYVEFLRTTVPYVDAHLEIFYCMHHPVIPKSDLYFVLQGRKIKF